MSVPTTEQTAATPVTTAAAPAPDVPNVFAPTRRWRLAFLLLTAALVGLLLLTIWMGEAEVAKQVTPDVVLRTLARHIPGLSGHFAPLPENQRYLEVIVWETRLPRALGGALIGMLLAMAGVAFQSLLMNPLADPYMVGVSSGSALGSVVIILLGGAGLLAGLAQPLAAFAAGLATMAAVYALAQRGGRLSTQTFLLGGIILGAFLWSLIQLTVSLSLRTRDPGKAQAVLSQLLGSLQYIDWRAAGMLLVFGIGGGILLWTGARELDLMTLGEESAAHLGVNTEAFKRRVILAGSLVTAAAVSVAGIIAFVGLIVPHIARRLVGPEHRILLPAAMLLGGITLTGADLLSRVYLNGLEIGVITSLLGTPVFCYLLRRRLVPKV